MADAPLDIALKHWAAKREGCFVEEIESAELDYDPGWPDTDETGGEPPELRVNYTVRRSSCRAACVPIAMNEIGAFIAEVADASKRVNLDG